MTDPTRKTGLEREVDGGGAGETEVPSAKRKIPRHKPALVEQPPGETGGAKGPEPTRYGDWQHKGRTTDF